MSHVCPDCGNAPTIHFMERWSAVADVVFASRINGSLFDPLLEKLTLGTMGVLAYLHLGTFLEKPDRKTPLRTLCLWEAAMPRGIKMYEFRLFGRALDTYVAKHYDQLIVFDGLPRSNSTALHWMDNKGTMHKKFQAAGIPVAQGGVAWSQIKALKIFETLPHPVIVKPALGSRSRHTTVHIHDEDAFVDAFKKAKQLSPWVMIERELVGAVYRATIIGGQLVGIVRRDPAQVVGNGHLTIRALVEIENKNPKRHGPVFHTIPVNRDALPELQRQGLTWESIPRAEQIVTLGVKTSRGAGGTTTDVTDQVHPQNRALFAKIGRVLDDPLVGIDFIIGDISKPWQEQPDCGIIECNSLPFIDLHAYPFEGKPRDAAGALWDLIFPGSHPIAKQA